jgi:hypothetical protein
VSRSTVLPLALAILIAAPAYAQTPNDALQKMYDAPLKRMYDDPMKKYYTEPAQPSMPKPPQIYPNNPLIPGGQPQPMRTFNQGSSGAAAQPNLPPGMVTGGMPYGSQPPLDPRFRRMDSNNDGRITREEYLRSQMQRTPVNPSYNDLEAGSLQRRYDSRFRGADANHDGRITRDEYDSSLNPRF